MKKVLIVLFVMLGLISFSWSNEKKEDSENSCTTCCTATVTYEGVYHSSYTACIPGCNSTSVTLACAAAKKKAQTFIDAQ